MKNISGFYLFIAALFVGMLFINSKFFQGSAYSNIGITEIKEYKISSERPGVIKSLHVIAGQEVKVGDLLAIMENTALEMEIIKLGNQINALKKEKAEKATIVQSRISYLKAEGGIKIEELNSEIQQIQSEIDLNKRLTEQFIPEKGSSTETSPQIVELRSLHENKKLQNQAVEIKAREMLKDHASELLILENEIDLKVRELELLQFEKGKLNKYSTLNGVVGNVFVRNGEEIEAFTPIISIHPIHPTSIVGYMVGSKARQIAIGAKVEVNSYEHKNITSAGEVIGLGSIIELPEILQKSTATKAFGRQIFIKIPEANNFASGEKVMIK